MENGKRWCGFLTAGVLAVSVAVATAREATQLKQWDFNDGCTVEKVTVPHCWNAIDGVDGGSKTNHSVDGNGYRRDAMLYARSLDVKAREDKRYFVHFGGASISSDVRVNGIKLGEHHGAFGAFCYEITPFLKKKDNVIQVTVDNRFTLDIAPLSGDFTMFGGMYRPVTLIETGPYCINPANPYANSGVTFTQTALSDAVGELEIETEVSGPQALDVWIIHTALDADGKAVASVKTPIRDRDTIKPNTFRRKDKLSVPNPIRWHGIENPYLYTIRTALVVNGKTVDQLEHRWGFRTIEITPENGMRLNGKPYKLRGVNRHQDRSGKGWAISEEDQREDMQIIREMGVNAVRIAHYPHSTYTYDLCDEHGFLVWPEIPLVEHVHNSDSFAANAKFQMSEMIAQHRNHPSIFVWGTANEIGAGANGRKTDKEASTKLLNELYAISKKEDPSRYCGITANPLKRPENDCHDLVGYNTYPGWYGSKPHEMKNAIENLMKAYPNKGISINEYGAGGSIHCHEIPAKQPKTVTPWHPEEYQLACHEGQYRAIKNAPKRLWGSFVWNMFDFGADKRTEGDRLGINDKGLVTYDRKIRKDVYYMYQANWSDNPMVHIVSRRYTVRDSDMMDVTVFSNCDTVELFVNGDSLGTVQPDDLRKFVWKNVKFQDGKNALKAVAKSAKGTVKDSYTFKVVK